MRWWYFRGRDIKVNLARIGFLWVVRPARVVQAPGVKLEGLRVGDDALSVQWSSLVTLVSRDALDVGGHRAVCVGMLISIYFEYYFAHSKDNGRVWHVRCLTKSDE